MNISHFVLLFRIFVHWDRSLRDKENDFNVLVYCRRHRWSKTHIAINFNNYEGSMRNKSVRREKLWDLKSTIAFSPIYLFEEKIKRHHQIEGNKFSIYSSHLWRQCSLIILSILPKWRFLMEFSSLNYWASFTFNVSVI